MDFPAVGAKNSEVMSASGQARRSGREPLWSGRRLPEATAHCTDTICPSICTALHCTALHGARLRCVCVRGIDDQLTCIHWFWVPLLLSPTDFVQELSGILPYWAVLFGYCGTQDVYCR